MSLATHFADSESERSRAAYTWSPFVDPRFSSLRRVTTTGTLLSVIALLVTNVAFIQGWRQGDALALGREHGILEMLQLAAMVPTFVLFALSQRYGAGAVKVAGGLLAMLTAAAFVREFEVEALGIHFSMAGVTDNNVQDVLLLMIASATIVYFLASIRRLGDLMSLAFRRHSWPLYAAAIPLAASVLLDGRLVTGHEMRFWEELIEYNGYLFLLVAAWRHAGLISDPVYGASARRPA